MELEIKMTEDGIELDNGSQFMKLSFEELKKIMNLYTDKVHSDRVVENLKKRWDFLGGL